VNRTRAVLLALLLVVSAVPLAAPALAVPDARLTVGDVTVSPETPVTGAPVTVDATIRSSAGSGSAATVDAVRLRNAGGETLAEATGLGALSPGDSLVAPLTTTFESPGSRSLTLVVVGTDADGEEVRVTRPVTVVVERAPPLVEIGPERLVAGVDNRVPVAVSNPTTEPMRNLVVNVAPDAGTAVDGRRTIGTLAAGATAQLNFSVRPVEGATELTVRTTYTTARGTEATAAESRRVVVEPLRDDVGVRVERAGESESAPQTAPGGLEGLFGGAAGGVGGSGEESEGEDGRRVDVTVTNFGNAPIESVVVTPRVGNRTLPRHAVDGPLAPGESGTVTVSLDRVGRAGDVAFEASYRLADGGRSRSVEGSYDYRPGDGTVVLTGLNVTTTDDGRVRIGGNAGNTGENPVTGVVVAVGEAPGVTPAYPQRDYFVGSVEGSEFAPFELSARVDGDASAIPVTVRYTVDGERVEREVRVPYDAEASERTTRVGFLGGLGGLDGIVGIVLGAGLALGVGALAFGVVARRRR
jgi:hypothetical protein